MEAILITILSAAFTPVSAALTSMEKEHLAFSVNDVKTSYSVTPGSSYTLSCPLNFSEYEASSPSPSSVLWFFNDHKIGSKSEVYSTTALRLHITRVTDDQYGNYTCRFRPLSGTYVTSPPMALTKGSAPSLNKKQRIVDVRQERLTQVACLGNFGSPTGRVTWFRDNDEIVDNEVFTTLPSGHLEVAGILSSLLFTVSTSTQNVKFHCEVTNEHGKDTSGLLELKLAKETEADQVIRRFRSSSDAIQVVRHNEGESAVLECGRDVTLKKLSLPIWKRIFKTSSSFINSSSSDGKYSIVGQFNLQINNVESRDSGLYECAIESAERYTAQHFHLHISETPKLTSLKVGANEVKTVTEHETVTFNCPVSGTPSPQIVWSLNSEPLVSGEFIKTSENGTLLTLFGVETKDRGVVQCMAVGPKVWISSFGFLDIIPYEEAPVSSDIGTIQSVLAETISSRFIQLTWEVSRSPHSEASASLNSTNNGVTKKNIAAFELRYAVSSGNVFPKRYKLLRTNSQSASFIASDLTPSTSYSFIIRALDESGRAGPFSSIKTVSTISENQRPGKVQGLVMASVETRQVGLRWSKAESQNSDVEYEVLYQEENTINGLTHKQIATSEEHVVLGLAEFTRYSFVVRAKNKFGFGRHSDAISCQTLSDMPSGYPNNIDIITDSTERLVIKWKPPALVDWNGYLTGYSIKFRTANERTPQSRKLLLSEREIVSFASALNMGIEAEEAQQRSKFILDGLTRDTKYEVAVAAINTNGTGPHSEWTVGKTMDHELSEDTIPGKCDLRVDGVTDTAISLSWDPPFNINTTKIRGYQVQCNKLFKLPWALAETLDNRQFEVTFRDLQPDTTYICALVAYNKSPKMSDINAVTINVKTKAERATGFPSSAPTNVKVMPLAEDTISIRFDIERNSAQFFQVRRESRVSPSVDREYMEEESLYLVNITRNYHHFSNLRPNTHYLFDVRSFNGDQPSAWSAKVSATTQEAAPGDAPQMFEASSDNSRDQPSVLLTWRSPTLPNGRIKGYIISYSQKIEATPWAMEPIGGNVFNHTVTKLKPESVYYFKMQAETSIGGGAWSDIRAVRTASLAAMNRDSAGFAVSDDVGMQKEHVYIIIAAVIGASLIIICLILAFLVCHVFSKASNKHRLNTIQYTPTSETAGYNGSTPHHMMASTVKGPPPTNSLFSSSPSDPQAAGFVEVKQIEQDALRKSPAEIMATHQNGMPFYQHPTNDSPSGGIRVPMPTPGVPMPQYQSMGGPQHQDMQFAMPPPPSNSNCVTPSAAQLPHLAGRSAFMTTSPLLKDLPDEGGNTLYPKGYHEVPTVQSPSDFNMQFVQPRATAGFYPHSHSNGSSHVSSAGGHPVTSSVALGGGVGLAVDNRCSTGALINQFVRPSASTVVARSKPPSYPQPIPLNTSSSASTIGIGARNSDDASSDRLTSTATEEDVNQATEKIMELMSRVNQISKNL